MNTFCDPSAVSVLHTIVQVCCNNDFKKIFNITFFKDKYRSLPCSIMWAICIKYKMVILNLVYSSMQPFSKNCFKFFTEALINLINSIFYCVFSRYLYYYLEWFSLNIFPNLSHHQSHDILDFQYPKYFHKSNNKRPKANK